MLHEMNFDILSIALEGGGELWYSDYVRLQRNHNLKNIMIVWLHFPFPSKTANITM